MFLDLNVVCPLFFRWLPWSSKWIFILLIAPGHASSDQQAFSGNNLIGTKIPALSATKTGVLHGWHEKGGTTLGYSELGLGLSEYYRDGQAIFIITRIDSKLNKTILDAKPLPMNIMHYKIVGNKLVFLKNAINRYSLAPYCESKKETGAIIIGSAKPDRRFRDCSHRTGEIYAAWAVDARTGKLRTTNPKGVTCLLEDFEDSCEHLQ